MLHLTSYSRPILGRLWDYGTGTEKRTAFFLLSTSYFILSLPILGRLQLGIGNS